MIVLAAGRARDGVVPARQRGALPRSSPRSAQHDDLNSQRVPVVGHRGKDLLLHRKAVTHRGDARDVALIVLEADRLVSNGAVHQSVEAERVVNELYEVVAQADPLDGDSIPGSIQQLLEHPLINTKVTPE
jgi:hypothetical protein